MFQYRAVVLEVVDGDSIRLDVDLGFHVHVEALLRIDGINAPELHAPDPTPGIDAKRYLTRLLPVGTELVVQTRKAREFEKYGRMLGQLTMADGTDVGSRMIDSGHAVAYSGGKRD